jgi:hypothetical protein
MNKVSLAFCRLGRQPRSCGSGYVGFAVLGCLYSIFAFGMPAQQPGIADSGDNAAPHFTTFEAPGAGTRAGQGTLANSVNTAGAIAGAYTDANGAEHGFVRAANGTITEFDAPGGTDTLATFAEAINAAGAITGYYVNYHQGSGQDYPGYHGFVRAASGRFTTFEALGAGNIGGQGTIPLSINAAGTVTGYTVGDEGDSQGFLRVSSGASSELWFMGLGTWAVSINAGGDVAGWYYDLGAGSHGFVDLANNTQISFDAPGSAGGGFYGTYAVSINKAGTVAGYYFDANNVYHGLVRDVSGTITGFDAPGAGTGSGQGTYAVSIDAAGAIAGYYIDLSGAYHGFVRAEGGAITTLEAPGAGTGKGQGTVPTSISAGTIAGYYIDARGVDHGFLLK